MLAWTFVRRPGLHGSCVGLVLVDGGLMLRAYLFDQRHGKKIDDWADVLKGLEESQVLWVDLLEPSAEEEHDVGESFGLDGLETGRLRERGVRPGIQQDPEYLRVTALPVRDSEADALETVALDCFVGENWVLTAHASELSEMEDFRELAEGAGEIGILDAPTFLAELMNWVVTSYLRAFDRIEIDLEEFDIRVLGNAHHDVDEQISELVEVRREVGTLRRSLAPHREVFAVLSRAEFDPLSTEESAKRFGELSAKVETALAAARDAKDAVVGSFDVLIARTEHRTNETVKVLTLASILLLPGALIAGVMGMNFKVGLFQHAGLFWGVNCLIVVIALVTLGIARSRRWI
jgi:magnesium transporter